MKDLLHESWPLVAVVALTVVLALQIPRRALFFTPVPVRAAKPYASFVSYDRDAYARLEQRVRMSWQVRAQGVDPGAGSHLDEFGLDEDMPPPAEMPLPGDFVSRGTSVATKAVPAPLLPPSVAETAALRPVSEPPDDDADARALRRELLELPQSLNEMQKEKTP